VWTARGAVSRAGGFAQWWWRAAPVPGRAARTSSI
ncbi:hypothetical protein A2U01_0055309, partial [Trifolium medium]|nr:hypothetical protein [Trifolium medium]